jgi:hypothetical protein
VAYSGVFFTMEHGELASALQLALGSVSRFG